MSNFTKFTQALEAWFADHQRHFPWRETRDPYKVWIAEVMSHQTQIQRVADIFYPRFIERFPNVQTLAKANWEQDVFPIWDGLGYYRRGHNVLKTAQTVVKKFHGQFPENPADLEGLPGIGRYTAAAIAAFAFNRKVPALDTNVTKIINTLWPRSNPVSVAGKLIQASSSGWIWNSAMMDLASHLRQQKPLPGDIAQFFPEEKLSAFAPNTQLPKVKKATPKGLRMIEVGIACIHRDGKYLIQTRPKGKSFAGSWEFPGGKKESGESFRNCVKREIWEEIGVRVSVRPHFYQQICKFPQNGTALKMRFHRCQIQQGTPKARENQEIAWIKPEDFFTHEGFLKTNRRALEKLQKMKV